MATINDLMYENMNPTGVGTVNDGMATYWSTGDPLISVNDKIFATLAARPGSIMDKLCAHWAATSGLSPVENYSFGDHKYYGI